MSSQRLRAAVIGGGKIAQIMHIPYLLELDHLFDLVALVDPSPSLGRALLARHRLPAWYATTAGLFAAEPDLDAVLVLTPDEHHAPVSIDALGHGCHVLVEKPMCLSPGEGRQMVAAADAAGRVLVVAYMKRHDPNVHLGARMLADLRAEQGAPQFIRAHCFLHDNVEVNRDVYDILQPDGDIPESLQAEGAQLLDRRLREAMGDSSETARHAYRMLMRVASHDISLVRGLFGEPTGVEFARLFDDGWGVLAVLDFDGVPCAFEIQTRSRRMWMDESVTVWYPSATLAIEFPSPFIKNSETRVIQSRTGPDGETEFSERFGSRDEAFRRQLVAFHAAIVDGDAPLTPAAEGLRDIALLREIALKTGPAAP
jgi:predicted dehydrogenase